MRLLPFLILIALMLSALPAAADPLPICGAGWRTNCIVDGDTVWVDGKKIRLEDIDAPEISEPRCPAELALGERAKLRLQELMNGAPFELVQVGSREHDVYGRELRTVESGGKSLGQVLVAEGLAHEWVGHKLPWC